MAQPKVDWTIYEPMLGKATDAEIARLAGCSPSRVYQRRRKKGIPPCGVMPDRHKKLQEEPKPKKFELLSGSRYSIIRTRYIAGERGIETRDYVYSHVTRHGLYVFRRADIGTFETFTRWQLENDYKYEEAI